MASSVLKLRHLFIAILLLVVRATLAAPLAAPGEMRLRHDLQLLNDSGIINIPLTAWPVALGDVHDALETADTTNLDASVKLALQRVKRELAFELDVGTIRYAIGVAADSEPRVIRTFENTPRDDGEVTARLSWLGNRFTINLAASYVDNPFDGDEFQPDGTYVGAAIGNWMLTAGWQERWWGPGRDGSLILSNNARPPPGVAIRRNNSTPFETKWLSWIGPWTLTSFMSLLDDERTITDAWLFGLRGSFRPLKGLEIGLTRTAQWCGDGRPCDLSTFADLVVGNDNRGINVSPDDEPGNQLGGIDIRWSLPNSIPIAAYMQWIGEDGRAGSGLIGSWLRQLGVEYWGEFGDVSHRTHFEVSDTMCKEGGFGLSDDKPNCAYEHGTYQTGYRYKGRSMAHAADADTLSYSIGSTLVQSAGHTWNATLRYMEINREGAPDNRHTLTPTQQDLVDVQLTHSRRTSIGRFYLGVSYSSIDDQVTGTSNSETAGFIRWTSY